MGAFTSSQQVTDDDNDMSMPSQYRYPPKNGKYFSSHFIMGGEKFETPQPETFLFGENSDLNFLSNRPALFPYPLPQTNEPTRAIQVLINVRKESIRFVPAPSKDNNDNQKRNQNETTTSTSAPAATTPPTKKLSTFNIEFTFDCDVDCDISIHYFCTEELTSTSVILHSRDSSINSDVYHYQKGGNQVFCQMDHIFDPSKYPNEDLVYRVDKEIIPVAIFCATTNEYNGFRQFQTTIAIVEKKADGVYDLKALKQKHFIDGLNCLLQEMYGIENKKTIEPEFEDDEDSEDNGYECVICMSDLRDTIILPCRHLCLCNQCANSLRYQSNNCPICRAPFRALLYVKALKKGQSPTVSANSDPLPNYTLHEIDIPEGYVHVPLMEALNGPAVQKSNSKAAIYEKMSRQSFRHRNVEDDDDSASYQSIRAQAVYPSIDRVKKGNITNKRNKSRSAHQRTSDSVLAEFSNRSDTQLDLAGDFTNSDLEISKHFVRSLSIRSENNPKRLSQLNEKLKKSSNSESQPIIMGKDEEDFSFEVTNGTPKKRLMSSVPDTPTSYFSMRSSTNSSSSTNQLLTTTTATSSANDKK